MLRELDGTMAAKLLTGLVDILWLWYELSLLKSKIWEGEPLDKLFIFACLSFPGGAIELNLPQTMAKMFHIHIRYSHYFV